MNLQRSSGLILHPTSLPGSGGVGTLGASARRFVDRLATAGQRWWQILPLNPPGLGGSPYSATSAFAGNPILLDLGAFIPKGWLSRDDIIEFETDCEKFPARRFAIDEVTSKKAGLLRRAADNWRAAGGLDDPDFLAFCEEHDQRWLDDFALFSALKDAHNGESWQRWPTELVRRKPAALREARHRLSEEIGAVKFAQWRFFEQWGALRDYAAERDVCFLGDLPIFVAMDSADAWANRRFFELDEDGQPEAVAGVPPDYFSETGQRWGNPLYDWQALAEDGYRWWVDRVDQVCRTVDLVRVDHFRGFESYWRIPADEPTAIHGEWIEGPKDEIFYAIQNALGRVPFVAEDLGIITDEVHRLRDRHELPGMKVLHFAFDGDPDHPFLPHTYPERAVAYTGTHDNDTTRGWYDGLTEEEKHRVRTYLSCSDDDAVWSMIERLWESRAALTIVPTQDLFELTSEARMNVPGEADGNWDWRMTPEELTNERVFLRLGELTNRTNRSSR